MTKARGGKHGSHRPVNAWLLHWAWSPVIRRTEACVTKGMRRVVRLLFRGATLGLAGCRVDIHPGGSLGALGPEEAAQEGLGSTVPPRLRGPTAWEGTDSTVGISSKLISRYPHGISPLLSHRKGLEPYTRGTDARLAAMGKNDPPLFSMDTRFESLLASGKHSGFQSLLKFCTRNDLEHLSWCGPEGAIAAAWAQVSALHRRLPQRATSPLGRCCLALGI